MEENEDLPGVPGAVQLYRRLQKAFPDVAFGLLHGQQSPKEKEAAAAAFRAGQIQVLVSTTVIEVGVDVPNATVMAIEHADALALPNFISCGAAWAGGSMRPIASCCAARIPEMPPSPGFTC